LPLLDVLWLLQPLTDDEWHTSFSRMDREIVSTAISAADRFYPTVCKIKVISNLLCRTE
jgi:hypothetical protein